MLSIFTVCAMTKIERYFIASYEYRLCRENYSMPTHERRRQRTTQAQTHRQRAVHRHRDSKAQGTDILAAGLKIRNISIVQGQD